LCWESGEQETEQSPLYSVYALLIARNGRMTGYDLRDPKNVKIIGEWEVTGENWREQLARAKTEMEFILA